MKEYKTSEELIDYLIFKKIKVCNREFALDKIQKYSYYSIINGYKDLFKDGDCYKQMVTFEEIFAMYEFDKNIKYIFLKYILEIEIQIKTLIAEQIAKNYGIRNYLFLNNLDDKVDDNIKYKLIEKINKEIRDNYGIHAAITHYKNNYGFIPPFVLVKILSFGVVSSFYGLLKQTDRQKISKHYNMSDKLLKQVLKNLTLVRNISAHSDRLYCFRSKNYIAFKNIDKNYKMNDKLTNLYMIVKSMELLLSTEEYSLFYKEFSDELLKLKNKLVSIEVDDVLKNMGFNIHKIN